MIGHGHHRVLPVSEFLMSHDLYDEFILIYIYVALVLRHVLRIVFRGTACDGKETVSY